MPLSIVPLREFITPWSIRIPAPIGSQKVNGHAHKSSEGVILQLLHPFLDPSGAGILILQGVINSLKGIIDNGMKDSPVLIIVSN